MKARSFSLANPSSATTLRCYCLILLSSVLVLSDALAQSSAWTRKTDVPIPRMGASAGVVKGKIYVFGAGGCYASCHTNLAANEVYVPLTDTWETEAPLPTPRGFLSTAVANDTIYAIGGAYPTLYNPLSVVEAYDPSTNAWTTRKDMLNPRFIAQAAVVDGILYNMGGNYSEQNCEAYDPNTNTWTRKKDRPESGGALSVTACNGLIYTFGGSTSSLQPFSTVYAYNPQTDTWTEKADMPTARFGLQTYLVDGKIYAIGGTQPAYGALATVEVYDPVNDMWESKPNMPDRLAWFGGAVVNNKIYVIGGSSDGVSAVSTLWEYDPAFHTDIAAGNVSGTWTLANSPYYINGEITIPNDSTLTIEPGVEVVFLGHYKFNVQGRLLAVGTEQDTIRFGAADTQTGWHGIRFDSTASTNDTSKIVYSVLRNGKANTGNGFDRCGGAMLIREFDRVLVSNCLFDSNMQSGEGWEPIPEAGPAIYIYHASPVIMNSVFSHHTGSKGCAIACLACPKVIISNNVFRWNIGAWAGPIVTRGSGSPIISGNTISDNVGRECAGGISVETGASPRIENNIITSNWAPLGGAILCWQYTYAVLLNNTIAYNIANQGGGIFFAENADPILINNILYGNSAGNGSQVCIYDVASDPAFLYCDIQGGKEGFSGAGAGANYTGRYENNIDADPSFMNSAVGDYRLSDSSLCIGTGEDSVEIAGVWYHVPAHCIGGNDRPSPAGTKPDIGACESVLGFPLVGVEYDSRVPTQFVIQQNYPNPFNPSTTIRYGLPHKSNVSLVVYNPLGQQVATLVQGEQEAGYHEVRFDGSGLSSGVYFYRIQVGDFVQTRKLLLIR